MMDQQPIVCCRKLGHCFGQGEVRIRAFEGVDLEVRAGEVVLLCGPAGSGKSSLLSAIGGLLPVGEGSLQVLGQELINADGRLLTHLRRQIGFVTDTPELIPSLTLAQNVALPIRFERLSAHDRQQRLEEALDAVGLWKQSAMRLRPECAGASQRRRAAIARAVIHRPPLILAVEPTSELDACHARMILDMFRRLARDRGTSVMIAGRDSGAIEIADRLISMMDGRIRSDRRANDITG